MGFSGTLRNPKDWGGGEEWILSREKKGLSWLLNLESNLLEVQA